MNSAALNIIETPHYYPNAHKQRISVPINILLVEDDASDSTLTEIALDAANIDYDLRTLKNGAEVLPYLCRQGQYSDERRPDMVMLDLSLPYKDGFEVLAEMAVQPERFGDIPIVILTGDQHCAFLQHSYDLNIAAYITKPCSQEKIRKAFADVGRHRQ